MHYNYTLKKQRAACSTDRNARVKSACMGEAKDLIKVVEWINRNNHSNSFVLCKSALALCIFARRINIYVPMWLKIKRKIWQKKQK